MVEKHPVVEEEVATGRRKTAVASVRVREGAGKILVNGKQFETYFPLEIQRNDILAPFQKVGGIGNRDLVIRVKGGGLQGQAEAARLGIARALVAANEQLRQDLKAAGFLKRDPRKKERKKYGLAGARKAFQFSKR